MQGKVVGKPGRERYFLREIGQWVEVSLTVYNQVFPDKKIGPFYTPSDGSWPMASEAAGVHPDQIQEASEADRALGVPTEYTTDGRPIFTDRSHRRRFLKAHGYHDNDGGYGDG